MAISTTIVFSGTTYELQCESIDHMFVRMPTQAGMPGEEATEPIVITVDLGVVTQQITMNGLVNTTSAGGNDPSKADLEIVCLKWWKYGDVPANLVRVNIPGGSYYAVLKTASFKMEGALEDRWNFSIAWLVREEI